MERNGGRREKQEKALFWSLEPNFVVLKILSGRSRRSHDSHEPDVRDLSFGLVISWCRSSYRNHIVISDSIQLLGSVTSAAAACTPRSPSDATSSSTCKH